MFRGDWEPVVLRVKSSRFWYARPVNGNYTAPRLAFTLRPVFEQLGVAWPRPAIGGANLGWSLSVIVMLAYGLYAGLFQ
jgi:hypothetical protein